MKNLDKNMSKTLAIIDELDKFEGIKDSEELRRYEKKYPILKESIDSIRFFELRSELKSLQRVFIEELDFMPIKAVIQNWLRELSGKPIQIKYASYISDLINRKILPEVFADGKEFTVGGLRHIGQKSIIHAIEQQPDLTDVAKNARIECYISFTGFLERITWGWFKKALPISAERYSTYRLSAKESCTALTLEEFNNFMMELAKVNYRDYLIALTMFYGVSRLSNVLSLMIDQIDFKNNIIRYVHTQQKITVEKPVQYPGAFMKQLKKYINSTKKERRTSKWLFVTRSGKRLIRSRLNYSFAFVSKIVNIKNVSPDKIRATWLMLKQRNEVSMVNIITMKEAAFEGC